MGIHLHKELEKLKKKLLALSSMVENNVNIAVRSIRDRDSDMAREVIEKDHEIDLHEVDVEEECLKILALHQPVAIDLRFVIAALKINNDLERIGDLASSIALRSIYLSNKSDVGIPFDYDFMVGKTREMLRSALDSLVRMDSSLAQQVLVDDDEVDKSMREGYNRVYIQIKANPNLTEPLIHYLTVCKNLERIADYATNIAEDVIYMIDGVIIRHGIEDLQSNAPMDI